MGLTGKFMLHQILKLARGNLTINRVDSILATARVRGKRIPRGRG